MDDRELDCFYAVKSGLFEKRVLDKPRAIMRLGEEHILFDHYYIRKGSNTELKYILCTNNFVSNYTTNLYDCLELARHCGVKTIPVGSIKEMIKFILDSI